MSVRCGCLCAGGCARRCLLAVCPGSRTGASAGGLRGWNGGVRTGQGVWRGRPGLGGAGEAPGGEPCKRWPQCAYFAA